MLVKMNDSRLSNITQLREFLKATKSVDLSLKDSSIDEKYDFIDRTIDRLGYRSLLKKEKKVVLSYLKKVTGYKQTQLFKLVAKACIGELKRKKYVKSNPNKTYQIQDVKLLEFTDEVHLKLNPISTQEVLRREAEVYGHTQYQRISQISKSHISNLRKDKRYRNFWVNSTKSVQNDIGETRKPDNKGIPGSIRVDTVHQRDIYIINAVDEVTQWEVTIAVPVICDRYMKSALLEILEQFPFEIFNFHSDRGGENINYLVAQMLDRLHINQTKSRARKTNDNALVECKNGHVIRKNFGWHFVCRDHEVIEQYNRVFRDYFNVYVNFHRPSLFPEIVEDKKTGKITKKYKEAITPYQKLKAISKDKRQNFLKGKLNFKKLDIIEMEYSDNEFATIMRKEMSKLWSLNLEKRQQQNTKTAEN